MYSYSKIALNLLAACFFLITISCEQEEKIILTPVSQGLNIAAKIDVAPEQSLFAIGEVSTNYSLRGTVSIDGNTFRPVLLSLQLTNGSVNVAGQVVQDLGGNKTRFYPDELLSENSTFRLIAIFTWEIQKNNTWEPIDAEPEVVEKTFSTTTYSSPATIINSFLPDNNTIDHSLFVNSLVVLNESIESPITNDLLTLRAVIDEVTLKQNNTEVSTDLVWNSTKDTLFIIPKTILKSLTQYSSQFKFHWEQQIADTWRTCLLNGSPISETSTRQFTTRNETVDVNRLLSDNIKHAYPIPYQFNFLKSEYETGFVTLNSLKQNYLFDASYQLKARFSSPNLPTIDVPLALDPVKNRLTHSIPPILINEKIYKLQYLRTPIGGEAGSEEEFYTSHFRTSMFNTFTEKITPVTFKPAVTVSVGPNGSTKRQLAAYTNSVEYFDSFEVEKSESIYISSDFSLTAHTGLIQFEAILNGNTWFENFINPVLLAKWEDASFNPTVSRNTTILSLVPSNAISFEGFTEGTVKKLTFEEIEANEALPITKSPSLYVIYSLAPIFQYDCEVISIQVRDKYIGKPNNSKRIRFFIERNSQYLYLRNGAYNYKIKYVLPDGTVTSSIVLSLYNGITDNGDILRWDEGL